MRRNIIGIYLLLILFGAVNLSYSESFIRVKAKYWNSKVDGKVEADTKLVTGTNLDFSDDLDLDETESIPEFEVKLKLGMNKLIASYWKSSYEGQTTLTRSINYAGTTYNASELLKSKLDLSMTSFLYERVLVPEFITKAVPSIAESELGLLLGVKYLSSETSLSSALASQKESGSAPIPVIGIFVQCGILNKVKFEIGAVGFQTNIGSLKAQFMDIYAEVDVKLIKYFPLGIGYKSNSLEISDDNSIDVDLSITGLYAFSSWEF